MVSQWFDNKFKASQKPIRENIRPMGMATDRRLESVNPITNA